MDFYRQALDIKEESVSHRRAIHKNAEAGICTPITAEYIENTLKSYGIPSRMCGNGVTATVGSGSPVILLRADMDALPMEEQSGEEFASTAKATHACGHDMHAAMLLGAAKLLKNTEKSIKGTVKFMFQPGEETLSGCKDMIKNGALHSPVPQATLALHTAAGRIVPGTFMYNAKEAMMLSADNFTITIKGKGGHGAYPSLAVDPINIAVQIYNGVGRIVPLELPSDRNCVVTIGKFIAGDSGNIIPDSAQLHGTVRTDDEKCREHIKMRIEEIARRTAELYGGSAQVEWTSGAPVLKCDEKLTCDMVKYIDTLDMPDKKYIPDMQAAASEDFAYMAQQLPSAYIYLSAGFDGEKGQYTAHNPKVCFNEDCLPIGAAVYAHCAVCWLKDNAL